MVAPLALVILVALAMIAGSAKAQIHFTNCASSTGGNGTVAIPLEVMMEHDQGYFRPDTGDEIAVYRPDGSLCAGVTVWDATTHGALTVWGDNTITEEIDGMVPGEVMKWRVWDSSANKEYDVNVTYVGTLPLWPNGAYGNDRLYQLASFTPTAVTLATFEVSTSDPLTGSLAAAAALVLLSILLYRINRKRSISS